MSTRNRLAAQRKGQKTPDHRIAVEELEEATNDAESCLVVTSPPVDWAALGLPAPPPPHSSRLPHEVKCFLVKSAACYRRPQDMVRACKEHFGIDIIPSRCESYDPTKTTGKHLCREFRRLFEATRRKYIGYAESLGYELAQPPDRYHPGRLVKMSPDGQVL